MSDVKIRFEGFSLRFDRAEVKGSLRQIGRRAAAATRQKLRQRKGKPAPPGQPPARQTGNLSRSISFKLARRALLVAVGSRLKVAPHGHLLEHGTAERRKRGGASTGRAEPRPFLGAMLEEFDGAAAAILNKAVEDAIVAQAKRRKK